MATLPEGFEYVPGYETPTATKLPEGFEFVPGYEKPIDYGIPEIDLADPGLDPTASLFPPTEQAPAPLPPPTDNPMGLDLENPPPQAPDDDDMPATQLLKAEMATYEEGSPDYLDALADLQTIQREEKVNYENGTEPDQEALLAYAEQKEQGRNRSQRMREHAATLDNDSPTAKIYKKGGYKFRGFGVWNAESRADYYASQPVTIPENPHNDPAVAKERKRQESINEVATGEPRLEILQALEAAGNAYEDDDSEANLQHLKSTMAWYEGKKKEIERRRGSLDNSFPEMDKDQLLVLNEQIQEANEQRDKELFEAHHETAISQSLERESLADSMEPGPKRLGAEQKLDKVHEADDFTQQMDIVDKYKKTKDIMSKSARYADKGRRAALKIEADATPEEERSYLITRMGKEFYGGLEGVVLNGVDTAFGNWEQIRTRNRQDAWKEEVKALQDVDRAVGGQWGDFIGRQVGKVGGEMAMSLLAGSAASSLFTPAIGSAVVFSAMGSQAGYLAYGQKRSEGWSVDDAMEYGIFTGLIETATESGSAKLAKFLGGISPEDLVTGNTLSKAASKALAKGIKANKVSWKKYARNATKESFLDSFDNPLKLKGRAAIAKSIPASMLPEALEEGAAGVLGLGLDAAYGDTSGIEDFSKAIQKYLDTGDLKVIRDMDIVEQMVVGGIFGGTMVATAHVKYLINPSAENARKIGLDAEASEQEAYQHFLDNFGVTKKQWRSVKGVKNFLDGRAEQEKQDPAKEAMNAAVHSEVDKRGMEAETKALKRGEKQLAGKRDRIEQALGDSTIGESGKAVLVNPFAENETLTKKELEKRLKGTKKQLSANRRKQAKNRKQAELVRKGQPKTLDRAEDESPDETTPRETTGEMPDKGADAIPQKQKEGEAAVIDFYANNDTAGYQKLLKGLPQAERNAMKRVWAAEKTKAKKAKASQVPQTQADTAFPQEATSPDLGIQSPRAKEIRGKLPGLRRKHGADAQVVQQLEAELDEIRARGPMFEEPAPRKPKRKFGDKKTKTTPKPPPAAPQVKAPPKPKPKPAAPKAKRTAKTPDGFSFYEQEDGSWSDNEDLDASDMVFENAAELQENGGIIGGGATTQSRDEYIASRMSEDSNSETGAARDRFVNEDTSTDVIPQPFTPEDQRKAYGRAWDKANGVKSKKRKIGPKVAPAVQDKDTKKLPNIFNKEWSPVGPVEWQAYHDAVRTPTENDLDEEASAAWLREKYDARPTGMEDEVEIADWLIQNWADRETGDFPELARFEGNGGKTAIDRTTVEVLVSSIQLDDQMAKEKAAKEAEAEPPVKPKKKVGPKAKEDVGTSPQVPTKSNAERKPHHTDQSKDSGRSWLRNSIERKPEGVNTAEEIADWLIKGFQGKDRFGKPTGDVAYIARLIDDSGKTPTTRDAIIKVVKKEMQPRPNTSGIASIGKPKKKMGPKAKVEVKPTVREVLKGQPLTPSQRMSANLINNMIGDMEVEWVDNLTYVDSNGKTQKASGRYHGPLKNKPARLELNSNVKGTDRQAHAAIHEAAHAVLSDVIGRYRAGEEVTKTQAAAIEQLDALRTEAIKAAGTIEVGEQSERSKFYGILSENYKLDEFISEALGNARFQEFLKETVPTGQSQSLWEDFIRLVVKVMGREAGTDLDLWSQVFAATEVLAETTKPKAAKPKAKPKTKPKPKAKPRTKPKKPKPSEYKRTTLRADDPKSDRKDREDRRLEARNKERDLQEKRDALQRQHDAFRRNATRKRGAAMEQIRDLDRQMGQLREQQETESAHLDEASMEDVLENPQTEDHATAAKETLARVRADAAKHQANVAGRYETRNVTIMEDAGKAAKKWQREADRHHQNLVVAARGYAAGIGLNEDEITNVAEMAANDFHARARGTLSDEVDSRAEQIKEARPVSLPGHLKTNLSEEEVKGFEDRLAEVRGDVNWYDAGQAIQGQAGVANKAATETANARKAEEAELKAEEDAKAEIQAAADNRNNARDSNKEVRYFADTRKRASKVKGKKAPTIGENTGQEVIRKDWSIQEEKDDKGKKIYSLTHIPSGLTAVSYGVQLDVRQWVQLADELGYDISKIPKSGKTPKALGKKLASVTVAMENESLAGLPEADRDRVLESVETTATEVEADMVLDAFDLGKYGGRGLQTKGLEIVTEMMDAVPEFAYDPVFTVDSDKNLVFRDGVTYKLGPELFNLHPGELTEGQTVGINVDDLDMKHLTATEAVAKTFTQNGFTGVQGKDDNGQVTGTFNGDHVTVSKDEGGKDNEWHVDRSSPTSTSQDKAHDILKKMDFMAGEKKPPVAKKPKKKAKKKAAKPETMEDVIDLADDMALPEDKPRTRKVKGRIWTYEESMGDWTSGKWVISRGEENQNKWMLWDGKDYRGRDEFPTMRAAMESKGNPIQEEIRAGGTYYHGGRKGLQIKNKPFHVGVKQAAIERITLPSGHGTSRTIHQVKVKSSKPYMPNGEVLDERKGSDRTRLFNIQNLKSEYKKLQEQGYDAVPYINAIEAEGNLSYLILNPSAMEMTGEAESGTISLEGEWVPVPVGRDYFSQEAIEKAEKESGSYKSREILIDMKVDDFLTMAEQLDEPTESKQKEVEGVLNRGDKLSSLPTMNFSIDDKGVAVVMSHEGRHRAMSLKARGVETIPVRFTSQGKNSIRWSEQSDTKNFDRIDGKWPTLLRGQDDTGKITRPTIEFPVADPAVSGLEELALPEDFHPSLRKDLSPQQMASTNTTTGRNVARALRNLRITEDQVEALARAGEATRKWYQNSTKQLRGLFGEDADRFIGVLAAMSPRVQVQVNFKDALRFWNAWDAAHRPTDEQEVREIIDGLSKWLGETWTQNVVRVVQSKDPGNMIFELGIDSPKVRAFYGNLIGDLNEVAIDGWMAQIAGFTKKIIVSKGKDKGKEKTVVSMNGAQYRALSIRIRRVADRMGWEPAEVQAAMWTFSKALASITEEGETTAESLPRLTEGQVSQVSDYATLIRENEDVQHAILNTRGIAELNAVLSKKDGRRSLLRKKTGSVLARAANPADLRSASRRLPEDRKKIGRTGSRTAKGVRSVHAGLALPAEGLNPEYQAKIDGVFARAAEGGQSLEDFKKEMKSKAGDKFAKIAPYLEELKDVAPLEADIFVSGMSRSPADLKGVKKAGHPVGVSLHAALSPTVKDELIDAANNDIPVFIDSGAFTTFTQGGDVDWGRIAYDWYEIANQVDRDKLHNLYIVAPDIVGNHEATLDLQEELFEYFQPLFTNGVRVIVPVQQGGHDTLAGNTGDASNPFLAEDFENVVIGIPFNEAAWSLEDVVELARVGVNPRIHLLGTGAKDGIEKIVKAIREVNKEIIITADATTLRARVGEGKALTKDLVKERAAKEKELGRPLTKAERGEIRTEVVFDHMKPGGPSPKGTSADAYVEGSGGAGSNDSRQSANGAGEFNKLKSIPVPELIQLAKELLGGKLPLAKNLGSYLGVFRHMPGFPAARSILLDLSLAKNEHQLAAVLAHEIGHLIDYLDDFTMKRGNILGRIGSMNKYLKGYMANIPGGPGPLTAKEKARLRRLAEKLSKKGADIEIDEEITKTFPVTAKDIIAIWNSVDVSKLNQDLFAFIKTLSDLEKKSIVMAAIKGKVPDIVKKYGRTETIKTGKKIVKNVKIDPSEVADKYKELLLEELKKRQLLSNEMIREELIELTKWWSGDWKGADEKYRKYRESSKELYAEALSVFLTSPGDVESRAPMFWRGFTNYIGAKPDVLQQIMEIQDTLNGTPAQMAEKRSETTRNMFKRATEAIRAANNARIAAGESPFESVTQFLGQYILDSHSPVKRRVGKARKGGAVFDDAENATFILDELNSMDSSNHDMLSRIERNVYSPLLKAGFDIHDMGEYLFMRRIVNERFEVLNPLGFTKSTANEQLGQLRDRLGADRFKQLHETMKEWHEIIFESVERAVEAGVYNKKLFRETIEPNKHNYATFAVTHYLENNAHISAAIFRQVGTLSEVANPMDATHMKSITLNRLIELNTAKNSVRDLMKKHFPDEINSVPIPFNQSEPKGQPSPGTEFMIILENGKPAAYEVPKSIARSFMRHDIGGLNRMGRVIESATYKIWHPLFVTYNPGFQVQNVPRDLRRTHLNLSSLGARLHKEFVEELMQKGKTRKEAEKEASSGKITLLQVLKEYVKAFPAGWARMLGNYHPMIAEMEKDKAIDIPFVSVGSVGADEAETDVLLARHGLKELDSKKAKGLLKTLIPFTTAGKIVEGLGVLQETLPKVAGNSLLKQRGVKQHERAYMVRKYVGTPDYKQRGLATGITNATMMYSKVRWNGLQFDGDLAFSSDTAAGWWWRRMIWTIMPTTYTKAGSYGLLGPALKEQLDRIPEYFLNNYDVIPWGFLQGDDDDDEKKGKVPFATISQDDTGRFIKQVWSKVLDGIATKAGIADRHTDTGEVLQDLFGIVWKEAVPSWSPPIDLIDKWVQYGMGANPKDENFNSNILTDSEMESGGWDAHSRMVTWTLNKFGIVSTIAHPFITKRFGNPFDNPDANYVETTLKAIPGISRLIRVSDRGLDEMEWAAIEAKEQEASRFRLGLPKIVSKAVSTHYYMSRRVRDMTTKEVEEKDILAKWYSSSYLPLTKKMKTVEKDSEEFNALSDELVESAEKNSLDTIYLEAMSYDKAKQAVLLYGKPKEDRADGTTKEEATVEWEKSVAENKAWLLKNIHRKPVRDAIRRATEHKRFKGTKEEPKSGIKDYNEPRRPLKLKKDTVIKNWPDWRKEAARRRKVAADSKEWLKLLRDD